MACRRSTTLGEPPDISHPTAKDCEQSTHPCTSQLHHIECRCHVCLGSSHPSLDLLSSLASARKPQSCLSMWSSERGFKASKHRASSRKVLYQKCKTRFRELRCIKWGQSQYSILSPSRREETLKILAPPTLSCHAKQSIRWESIAFCSFRYILQLLALH